MYGQARLFFDGLFPELPDTSPNLVKEKTVKEKDLSENREKRLFSWRFLTEIQRRKQFPQITPPPMTKPS